MNIQNALRVTMLICLGALSLNAVGQNTHVILDNQEITAFLSGYDIDVVTFTLDANETLTIEIKPFGVPGDADGDGNADASSNPAIQDGPGVGPTEFIRIGLACQDPAACTPDVFYQYSNNTLMELFANPSAGAASFAIVGGAYVMTIPNFGQYTTDLGGIPFDFGAFNFSASVTDLQVDDAAPDTGCEQVSLELPVVGKTPFDCFHVNKVQIKDKNGTNKDKLKIHKAGIRIDAPNSIDMNTDMLQLRVDGMTVDFSIGSFVEKKPGDWVYKSASGSKPSYTMRINFNKDSWDFKMKDGDVSLIDQSDGIDVALMIGDYESEVHVAFTGGSHGHGSGGSHSGSHGSGRNSCRLPSGTHGHGSSDSGSPGSGKLSCISSMTVEYVPTGELITKTRVEANIFHPNTVFTETDSGNSGTFHTSCSACLTCGDVASDNPDFVVIEVQGLPGDKLAQKCGVPDASCAPILP